MVNKYRMYVINSTRGIGSIFKFIQEKAKSVKDIGPMRKDYCRDVDKKFYIERPRRFIILSTCLYEHLCALGYGEHNAKNENFEIFPYKIMNDDYSHRRSSTMNFYFPMDKEKNNAKKLTEKMEYFTAMGMISKDDWYIHKANCVCEFSKRVDDVTKIYIKIIVDCPTDFRVSWCRIGLFNNITPKFSPKLLSPATSKKD